MRTSYFLISLFAAFTGIASASASIYLAPEDAYVKVKYQGVANYTCQNTGLECENSGAVDCLIEVYIDLPTTRTKVVKAFRAGCTQGLKHTNSEIQFFDPPGDNVEDAMGSASLFFN